MPHTCHTPMSFACALTRAWDRCLEQPPSPDLIEASYPAIRQLVAEVAACSTCLEALSEYHAQQEAAGHPHPTVIGEAEMAHYLLAELAGLLEPVLPADRIRVLQESREFHHWGLARLLMKQSVAQRLAPATSVESARRACIIANALLQEEDAREQYGRLYLHDLAALAHAHFGDACRRFGQLQEAAGAFDEAQRHLSCGTGGAAILLRVLTLKNAAGNAKAVPSSGKAPENLPSSL